MTSSPPPRPPISIVLAGLLAAGCAATGPFPRPGERGYPPLLEVGIETAREGPLEPRQFEPIARLLTAVDRPLTAEEEALAHAAGLGLLDRLAKKREWGTRAREIASDLDLAAHCHALAPERFSGDDIARFVEEVDRLHAPSGVGPFLDRYTGYGLPRSATASAAIIRTLSGRFPVDGLLEDLFYRGFRIDDATLRSYAETIVADRFAVDDLLFVIRRTEAPGEVAAHLPQFAARLMGWVHARAPADGDPAARRKIYHNGVVALLNARDLGVALPGEIFERYVRSGAGRPDLDLDDLAAAFEAYGRSAAGLLDERLAALRGARATREALVELVEVAALMRDQDHPHAADALALLQRAIERPLGIDERIGAPVGRRPYSRYAVRRLSEQLIGPLAGKNRARLYLDTVAGLLGEQGEREIALRFAARNFARK